MKYGVVADNRTYAEIFGVDPKNYSKVDVEKLQFKIRSSTIMATLGCRTLESLLGFRPVEIIQAKDSGQKTLDDIAQVIDDYFKNGTVKSEYDFTTPGMQVRKFFEIYGVKSENFGNVEIETLAFGVKVRNCLQMMKCETLQELLNYTPGDIMANKGSGKTTVLNVKDVLDDFFSNKPVLKEITWATIDEQLAVLPAVYLQKLVCPFFLAFCKILDNADKTLIDKLGAHTTFQQLRGNSWDSLLTEKEKKRLSLFLNWLPKDLDEMYRITNLQLYRGLNREQDLIVRYRSDINPWTLDAIGKKFNESKQSVQQKESRAIKILTKNYVTLMYDPILFCAAWYGKEFVDRSQVEKTFGLEVTQILFWKIITEKAGRMSINKVRIVDVDWCLYRDEGDLYQIGKVNINFDKALEMVNSLPETLCTDELNTKIIQLALQYGIDMSLLFTVMYRKYRGFGIFSTRKNSISKIFMRDYILKNYFRYGYKVGNHGEKIYEDAQKFKKYLDKIFGYDYEGDGHALDSLISKTGVLVGRGKYVHKDYFSISEADMDTIYGYIEIGPQKISFHTMFDELKSRLPSSVFKNRYVLHGALTKYGCEYYFDRDYIYKDKLACKNVVVDNIIPSTKP